MLGTQTQGGRMEGADESTEQCGTPFKWMLVNIFSLVTSVKQLLLKTYPIINMKRGDVSCSFCSTYHWSIAFCCLARLNKRQQLKGIPRLVWSWYDWYKIGMILVWSCEVEQRAAIKRYTKIGTRLVWSFIKPNSHPNGFTGVTNAHGPLTVTSSKQVSNMRSDDCNRK